MAFGLLGGLFGKKGMGGSKSSNLLQRGLGGFIGSRLPMPFSGALTSPLADPLYNLLRGGGLSGFGAGFLSPWFPGDNRSRKTRKRQSGLSGAIGRGFLR